MTNSTIADSAVRTADQDLVPAQHRGLAERPGAEAPRSAGPRARIRSLLKHLALILTGGVMIYPLIWMVVSSLRPDDMIFREPGILLQTLETANYSDGWSALSSPFSVYLFNSAVVVLGCDRRQPGLLLHGGLRVRPAGVPLQEAGSSPSCSSRSCCRSTW